MHGDLSIRLGAQERWKKYGASCTTVPLPIDTIMDRYGGVLPISYIYKVPCHSIQNDLNSTINQFVGPRNGVPGGGFSYFKRWAYTVNLLRSTKRNLSPQKGTLRIVRPWEGRNIFKACVQNVLFVVQRIKPMHRRGWPSTPNRSVAEHLL